MKERSEKNQGIHRFNKIIPWNHRRYLLSAASALILTVDEGRLKVTPEILDNHAKRSKKFTSDLTLNFPYCLLIVIFLTYIFE